MIHEAVAAANDPNATRVTGAAAAATRRASDANIGWGAKIQRILLTGVSYMIPFVAGGGLLIALGFLLGGYQVGDDAAKVIVNNALWDLPPGGLGQYLGSVAFMIGVTSMNFLVPALAGYIAFAIADRPGIAPGFVAGAVAVLMSSGFIGGIAGGLLAGFVALWFTRLEVPRWLRGLMPVVIIPLIASIVASGILILFLGRPIATLMEWLNTWLNDLAATGADRRGGRDPRHHDVLRPRRTDQQGRLRLRGRRSRCRLGDEPDAVPHHVGRHVRGHGAAARDGARLHGSRPRSVPAGRA